MVLVVALQVAEAGWLPSPLLLAVLAVAHPSEDVHLMREAVWIWWRQNELAVVVALQAVALAWALRQRRFRYGNRRLCARRALQPPQQPAVVNAALRVVLQHSGQNTSHCGSSPAPARASMNQSYWNRSSLRWHTMHNA